MSGLAFNSSFSESSFNFWKECEDELEGPSLGLVVLFTTSIFEFLVSAPANLWLTQNILRNASRGSGILPPDFFPLHLALIQLTFYLFAPMIVINHLFWHTITAEVIISLTVCLMYTTKPLLLCLVCMERYIAVVRPHHYLRYKGGRYRGCCMVVIWGIYIITTVCDIFHTSLFLVAVTFISVVAVNTCFNMATLKALKKPPPGDREMAEKDKRGERKGKTSKSRGKRGTGSQKRRAFITTVIIQAVVMLNYLPSILAMPLYFIVSPHVFRCQYLSLSVAASTACGYVEPLLHLYRHVK